MNDQVRISPYNNNIILSNQVFRIKEKYQLADYKLIQYQILQTYIIRIVWQTVRRITNEILEVRGITCWYLEDIGEYLNIVLFCLQQLHGHLLPWCQRFGGTRNGCTQRWDGSTRCVYKKNRSQGTWLFIVPSWQGLLIKAVLPRVLSWDIPTHLR